MSKTKSTNFLTIPYDILNLEELTLSAKVLLAEILSLSKLEGHCYASNEYLSKRIGISERSVCNSLNELRQHNLISSSLKSRSERCIYPVFSSLKERNICAPTYANSAQGERKNCAQSNANSAHNNNIYNINYNNKYKENRKNDYLRSDASYDIEELMIIR